MTDNEGRAAPPEGAAQPTVRGTARERLRDAARRLMTEATLDDLTSFITVRRLTEDTGLSSGAVYSAFAPDSGVGSRSRSAPQAAGRAAFWSLHAESDSLVSSLQGLFDSAIDGAGLEGLELLEGVAELLTGPITDAARGTDGEGGWSYTQLFLGGAVALNDREVASFLGRSYEGYDRAYIPGLEVLLRLAGRELVDGVDLRQFAQMLVTAADGCALRLRVDPDLDPAIVRQMYLAVWIAMTRRADVRDDQLGHRLAIAGQRPLDDEQQDAVRRAVLRVHGRAGWPAVTLAKVAQLSGVSDARLAGRYPSRHDLAVIVWDDVVAGVERRDAARSALPADIRLGALLEDVCDTACSQRALMASLLIAHLNSTSEQIADADDPGSHRMVELLASSILATAEHGGVDLSGPSIPTAAGDGFRVMARATLDLVLLRSSTSTMAGHEMAALIVDGMVGAGVVVGPLE
ncbi:hypothetical protein [Dermatobacter hominis]|uniref:hypothetical protein n=1 Tax=Dermatobacter hominis TaxID=2884263 RepID=UPI001D117465|nr:hypothetical protein [Dermatobacter hominis]UDY34621.1 hypothetical protein LH044_14910 [Dermatobacter hominis]